MLRFLKGWVRDEILVLGILLEGVGHGLAPQDDLEDQLNYGLAASPAAEPVVRLSVPQFLHSVDQHPVDQQPGGFPSLDQCGVEVVELQSPKVGD